MLCKQTQKSMKSSSYGLQTKPPSKVDMGNLTVPISSLGNVRKCEKMWDPYVNKPKNQWKAHRVDSRRSLPLVKSIWALQWCHFRVLKMWEMWESYVNKPKNQWRALHMDSRRSLPLVKSIWALQWYHFRFLESVRNVRTLCKQLLFELCLWFRNELLLAFEWF